MRSSFDNLYSLSSRAESMKELSRCRCSDKFCEIQQTNRKEGASNRWNDCNVEFSTANCKSEKERERERDSMKQQLMGQFYDILNSNDSQSLLKQYSSIPEHDKRILNCMLLKRSTDALNLENSYLARKYWEEDKQQHNDLIKRQQMNHLHWLRTRQDVEKCLHAQRSDALYHQYEHYVNTIQREIEAKQCRLDKRLERLEYERNVMQQQRQLIEKQKCDQTARVRQWNDIEMELQKHERSQELDSRMARAHDARKNYLNILKRRTMEVNERHQLIHAINFEEIKELERLNLNYLKEKVADCDRRSKQFISNKMHRMEESRERAFVTAHLRQIIRESITPDSFSCRN